MDQKLTISPAPHIHGKETTRRLMLDVIIALMPALAVSTWVFGLKVLAVTAVSVVSCVLSEYLIQRFMIKGPKTINNLSAVVTGVLLAFNLPHTLPLWLVVLGALVAIGVGKMTFGGLGKNPFNPALVGRVFLLISFPIAMTTFPGLADSITGATPLTALREAMREGIPMNQFAEQFSYQNFVIGLNAGSFGEVSVAALLLGFVYLLIRKVVSWHIPVFVLGSMFIFAGILWQVDTGSYMDPFFHILTGGAILGAVYMATDYTTSPMTHRGMLIFGVGIGLITMLIRVWGGYPEGMSFAILVMNAFVPLIDKYIKPRRFGSVKAERRKI